MQGKGREGEGGKRKGGREEKGREEKGREGGRESMKRRGKWRSPYQF